MFPQKTKIEIILVFSIMVQIIKIIITQTIVFLSFKNFRNYVFFRTEKENHQLKKGTSNRFGRWFGDEMRGK